MTSRGGTSWDTYTSTLAEGLQPWVPARVLNRFVHYQDACARVIYLYVCYASSEPDRDAVSATCITAISVCVAVCVAGFEALNHHEGMASNKAAAAVLDAFAGARPEFDALLASLPVSLASLAREKYYEFSRLMASIAATGNLQVGVPVLESLTGGMHAAVDRFGAIHPERNGEGRVGSPAWEQRRKAWARGEA
jgi:hypothetical protein